MPSDHKHFNCSEKEDYELDYVIYKVYELNEDTSPTTKELKEYIRNTLCTENHYMTHDFLYKEIEKEFPTLEIRRKNSYTRRKSSKTK